MRKISICLFIIMAFLAAASCDRPPAAVAPATPAPAGPSRPAWQADWDKAMAGARSEGRLVIYNTGGVEVRNDLTKAFKEKYGVDLEFISGRGAELATKILSERRAGIFTGDLYLDAMATPVNTFKPAGALAPIKPLLILPEVLDTKAYYGDAIPFGDNEGIYILTHGQTVSQAIAINPNLVKQGEITSFADLTNPRWKGKIVMDDPAIGGAGATFFLMTTVEIMNLDFHRQLAKNEPVVNRDPRQTVEWVAKEKYPIAVAPYEDVVADFQKAGAPVKWVLPKEGTWVSTGASGTLAYLDHAPHPNASKVFANWLLTKEGLTIWSRSTLVLSARKDVPTDFLPPEKLRVPGTKYAIASREDLRLRLDEMAKLATEVYGPLLGK